jgi:hypothetical protein
MLDDIRSYSSENWQLFYNDGIYFIRNYDYSAAYQLGVEPRSSTTRMLLRGPGPEMQWNITRSGDGWLLKNMLLGDNYMLGVDGGGTTPIIPVMSTEKTRAVWTITVNLSAGQITDEQMLSKLPLEVGLRSLGSLYFSSVLRHATLTECIYRVPRPRPQPPRLHPRPQQRRLRHQTPLLLVADSA